MRKTHFFTLVILFISSSVIWAQTSGVSAERNRPPTYNKGADAKVSSPIRFDGMYFGRFIGSYSYLRFFDDGEVAAVNFSEPRTLSDLKRRHDQKRRSTYKIDGNKITLSVFLTPNKADFFEGTIDGDTITIDDREWKSTVYTFVP